MKYLFAAIFLAGCAAGTQGSQQVEVGSYGFEDQLCIKNAMTRAEADTCRKAVLGKYCAMWRAADAGVAACEMDGGK